MERDRVRQLVRALLDGAADFEGRAELLAQVDFVDASGSPTWVNLTVRPGIPAAPVIANPVPGRCWAHDDMGQPIATLVLWTADGWLSDLEIGWVTEDPPTVLPDPSSLHP